jgi:ribose 5-phosphate isomerase RpiB
MTRVAARCDHAGFSLRTELIARLADPGREVVDLGTDSTDTVDHRSCGAAIGSVPGVRAATAHDATSPRLTREYNDANVTCSAKSDALLRDGS